MDDEKRRLNAFLRGESMTYVGITGTVYRRVCRDGRDFFEQSYADGQTSSTQLTPGLQALFDKVAATDDDAGLYRIFREGGVPLPGDPNTPTSN